MYANAIVPENMISNDISISKPCDIQIGRQWSRFA